MIIKHLARAFSVLLVASPLLLAPGCSSEAGGEGGGSGEGGSGSGNNTTSGGNTCEAKCASPDECESLACACNDGTTVNTTSCDSGCCATEEAACPDSCSDHGGWGSSGNGSTGSGSTTGDAEVGDDCSSNADCESGICFYVNVDDESVQKCTKTCSFGGGECDDIGWDCAEITNEGETQYLCIMP